MARVVFFNLLMFLLPFVIYGAYIKLTRAGGTTWSDAPILWLFAFGTILMLATMIALVSFTGSGPSGSYHPSIMKDGKVEPGQFD